MKKTLLTLAIAQAVAFGAFAQRMTLHEEFTGENCGPCASTNPGFWALCDTAPNVPKLIHISYMAPIPSPGWYYARTSVLEGVRETYYSVPFAPYGRYDGHTPDLGCSGGSSAGHPGCFTQADIDAEYAIPDSFTITATNAWNSTYDSVITTVTVHCVTAWTGSSSVYLRAALVETNTFATPPGDNGESHFENVVQAMYPDATGTSITGTWAAGATQTYIIRGKAPSYLDYAGAPYMVVWIQDDANKVVAQAAKAGTPLPPIPNDAAITAVAGPSGLSCAANGTTSVSNSVTLKNSGNNTITSATIYYGTDGGALTSYAWSGSLAVGATTTVTLPTASVTVAGANYHSLYDSVAMPNGSIDQDPGNNASTTNFFIESTNGLPMPYTTSLERADWHTIFTTDANTNGEMWMIEWAFNLTAGVTTCARTDSFAMWFDCYQYAAGESEIFTLPEVAYNTASSIEFWTAHTYYTAGSPEADQLEVVYSTNCGASWTSIWSKSGTVLANVAVDTNFFVPTPAQYVQQIQSLSAVPAGAMLAFRGTSGWGNNIFVDDITITSTVGVNHISASTLNVNVFPNPTKDNATLSLNLVEATNLQINIVDGLGRTLNTVANEKVEAGSHNFAINTTALAMGVYNIMIVTDAGTFTQRLNVVK